MVTIEKLPSFDYAENKRLAELDLFIAQFDDEFIHPYTKQSFEQLHETLAGLEKQYQLSMRFQKSTKEILDMIKLVEGIIERKQILSGDGNGVVLR